MRRFYLQREEDPTGMSGTGRVADGIEFANGLIALTWKSEFSTLTIYQSITAVEKLHTHNGKDKTRVVWVDDLHEDVEAKSEELARETAEED